MKSILMLLTVSSISFGQGLLFPEFSTKYYQCQSALGFVAPPLNDKGEFPVTVTGFYPEPKIETVKTDNGEKKIYTYNVPNFNGKGTTKQIYSIEKNKNGEIICLSNGGEGRTSGGRHPKNA